MMITEGALFGVDKLLYRWQFVALLYMYYGWPDFHEI